MDPSDQWHYTPPRPFEFSPKETCLHGSGDTLDTIDFLTLPKHPSDTYVLTMKMEILLEPASNKLLVGNELMVNQKDSNYLIHSYRVVCFETFWYNIYTVKRSYGTGGYIKMEMVMPHSS
ncbi:hypothetical protein Tco_0368868 [Tanacetum coccineum]